MSFRNEFKRNINPKVDEMLGVVKTIFESQSCVGYVKTIYMGFDMGNVMVSAVYPHKKHLEIALALDENHPDVNLRDASHLTWRTLPVSLELFSVKSIEENTHLLIEACNRIRAGNHIVMRDNDFFRQASEQREKN